MYDKYLLPSKLTGTPYHLYLSPPSGSSLAEAPLDLALVMDGDDQFGEAVAARNKLLADGLISAVFLLGVGYGAGYRKPTNRRMRDYTPTDMKDEPGTGGGDLFLRFIREELFPWLDGKVSFDPETLGICGHSLGSLLGLYGFFQRDTIYKRCLASAPSLWYADRWLISYEQGFSDKQHALAGKLFLSAGENDTPSMLGDLQLFESQLNGHPYRGLEVSSKRFPGRDHYNVLADAYTEGLKFLYPASSSKMATLLKQSAAPAL